MAELTATTTFREWYGGGMGPDHINPTTKENLKLIGRTDEGELVWRLRKDVFTTPESEYDTSEGDRSGIAAYALYRRQILKLDGEPSDYERPVKEWNA